MGAMNSWMSMRMILISAGVLSAAMGLKLSIPIAVENVPALWSVVISWMKPPYLYIIINGIIITIAASSRFHQRHTEPAVIRSERLISVITPTLESFVPLPAQANFKTAVVPEPQAEVLVPAVEDRVVDLKPVVVNGLKVDFATEVDDLRILRAEAEDVFDESDLLNNSPKRDTFLPEVNLESLFPAREKPLASSRFVHRKPNRTPPEGAKALRRVARPKKQETLESTWKMITEGRHVPLTRHLKKSDTFEQQASPAMDHVKMVPKSETFKERSNYEARIRKEPSLGQDELNRRVEAFINKFNEDMRMQRQESLQQFHEMINRGV
ncbi:uncharacterized protein LOC121742686 isoform X2 [Salvia splendens]|uniref:uncharacterized protein LOC121742670 isoform X2 n=1 Tax=Salvia splendens TaxID=180675 RepID=UPI001C26DFA2|nr:uncharacterized protein LOC121742670 isoform X2 [Salvia splendens]XP_041991842.1 uncharacterized protein LOC121742686 isoform X2 [Salvia splendens]